MAIFYVDGGKINIPTYRKPFGFGSEGNLYLVNDKLYKIYNANALNEGFGNKKIYHQSLLGLKDSFKKFILPESLIFNEHGDYVGYVTELVGDKSKRKEGITEGSWDNFIKNIKDFETEIDLLSNNRFFTVDIGFHNSIFSKDDGNLYMVDPGRYHHETFFTLSDYTRKNRMMLEDYFFHMLQRETAYFKLAPIKEVSSLIGKLKDEKNDLSYSEYFENASDKYDSIHQFIKSKGKWLE